MTKTQEMDEGAEFDGVGMPAAQGLYDPANEHDSCGVGFIADLKGRKSHRIVHDALEILANLEHRGAVGADPLAGDGAGILIQIPHDFLKDECRKLGFTLPPPGRYAVGHIFMPRDERLRAHCERVWTRIVKEEGLELLGWRSVPVDNSSLSEMVKGTEPVHRQVFIGRPSTFLDQDDFERALYLVRKIVSNAIVQAYKNRDIGHYTVSLSSRTLVYKGMFLSYQVKAYYTDLSDPRLVSAMALVHQRFSTNTFPSWKLAHPYRIVAHNGEINTLRGNVNWMAARQASVTSPLYGDDISKLWPISYEGQSDTACFDNALEFLVMGGYSLTHAAMMLIPEAWAGNPLMDRKRRAFYEYHACLMEPWDGPAAMCFSDGRQIGATLDRNGLRPARYFVTKDGLVVMASEVGRAADARRVHRPEVAPAAGQDAADRPGEGPHRLRRGAEGRDRRQQPVRDVAEAHPDPGLRSAAAQEARRGEEVERGAARSAAGVRLHAGKPQVPDDADGAERPGGHRLHGHRHADLGAVVEVEAAAHLFQAELRAGHEPADRLDPRGARHEPRVVHRTAAEPARPRRHLQAEAARGLSADPHQRGPGAHPPDRRGEGQRVLLHHPRHHLCGREGRGGHGVRRSTACAPRPRKRCARRSTTSSSCPTAASVRTAFRFLHCWRRRRCTTT